MDFVVSFIKPKIAALLSAQEANTPSAGAQSLLFELNALVDTAGKMFTSQLAPAGAQAASQHQQHAYLQQLHLLQQQLHQSPARGVSQPSSQASSPVQQQTQIASPGGVNASSAMSSSSSSSSQPQSSSQAQASQLPSLHQQQMLQQQQQRSASSRFAIQVAHEVKVIIGHARKLAGGAAGAGGGGSGSRAVALYQALHDIVVFRIQLYQFYSALGSKRLRSLSMERASLSIAALSLALERSPLTTFDPHIAALARCEATCLAALLRAVSHTARIQFVPALLSVAEARAALSEWTAVQMSGWRSPSNVPLASSLPLAPSHASMSGFGGLAAAQSPRNAAWAGGAGGVDAGGSASMTYGAVNDVSGAMSYAWIHEWLDAFAHSCIAHIELVFNQHLSACIGPSLATLSMTPKASLVQLIEAFVAKSEAQAFGLVLDCNRAARASVRTAPASANDEKPPPITFSIEQPFIDAFAPTPTLTPSEAPSGMASFPVIFARPATASLREHMPNVVSIILDQAATLLTRINEPLLQMDKQLAYLIIRMGEPHLFGVSVWMSRAPRQLDYAMRVLPHIAALSRHAALFDALHDASNASGDRRAPAAVD